MVALQKENYKAKPLSKSSEHLAAHSSTTDGDPKSSCSFEGRAMVRS